MAGDFSLDLTKFAEKAKGNIDKVVRKVVLDLGEKVVERSPVGDPLHWKTKYPPPGYVGGRFRANWQHGIGVMPTTTFNTTDNVSMERIQSTLAQGTGPNIHWLVNNVEYSIALENGHSWRQAPQGIVKLTVLEFPGIVSNAAAEVRK